MRIAALTCPECDYEFIVDTEFLTIADAYCHCPRCAHEFPAAESPSIIT